MVAFIVNLYHDGVFVPCPLKYMYGCFRIVNDINFVELDDPEEHIVETKYKAKKSMTYPTFDHDEPWNECKLFLGMRDVTASKCEGQRGKKPKPQEDDDTMQEEPKEHSKLKAKGKAKMSDTIKNTKEES
nr:hypothetical protein [Tanacetum cinerariifolium]